MWFASLWDCVQAWQGFPLDHGHVADGVGFTLTDVGVHEWPDSFRALDQFGLHRLLIEQSLGFLVADPVAGMAVLQERVVPQVFCPGIDQEGRFWLRSV